MVVLGLGASPGLVLRFNILRGSQWSSSVLERALGWYFALIFSVVLNGLPGSWSEPWVGTSL